MSPLLKLNLQVIWIYLYSKTKVISASEALGFGLGFVSDRTNS